jgi:hypothetical protein
LVKCMTLQLQAGVRAAHCSMATQKHTYTTTDVHVVYIVWSLFTVSCMYLGAVLVQCSCVEEPDARVLTCTQEHITTTTVYSKEHNSNMAMQQHKQQQQCVSLQYTQAMCHNSSNSPKSKQCRVPCL